MDKNSIVPKFKINKDGVSINGIHIPASRVQLDINTEQENIIIHFVKLPPESIEIETGNWETSNDKNYKRQIKYIITDYDNNKWTFSQEELGVKSDG